MLILVLHEIRLRLLGKFLQQGIAAGLAEAILKDALALAEGLVDLVAGKGAQRFTAP
jgi:hypothetical protein